MDAATGWSAAMARSLAFGNSLRSSMPALICLWRNSVEPGEARLLLMAALLTTDELLDTRVKLDEAVAEAAAALRAAAAAAAPEPVPEKRPDNSRKSQRVELPGKAQAG